MTIPKKFPDKLKKEAADLWQRFREAAVKSGLLASYNPSLVQKLSGIFALSQFVADTCCRNPRLLNDLIKTGDLERSYTPGEFQQKVANAAKEHHDINYLGEALRKLRCREMVRLACRDLGGWADLGEVIEDLSAFADACIQKALKDLYADYCRRYGTPFDGAGNAQQMVVVAMGKLGAHELNFSSDIDLVFAYPKTGATSGSGRSISNIEFFTRLGRALIDLLGKPTAVGNLFRVDMRLRPYGDSGPIVMSFEAMEQYYQRQGREWERYAWIKARVVTEDQQAATNLLSRLKPFVYRRYLDYGAFESLREMKAKISQEIHRAETQSNIKLGRGGIREIEFFGQMFQLIRGGLDSALQKKQILYILDYLATEGLIPQSVGKALTQAYVFLRNSENHLQEFSDRQTHLLPTAEADRLRLAISMEYPDWSTYCQRLEHHRNVVQHHFNLLLTAQGSDTGDTKESALIDLCKKPVDSDDNLALISQLGFKAPAKILVMLKHLVKASATRALSVCGKNRLERLLPILLKKVGASAAPDHLLSRILDLIKSIERRTCYLSLLLEEPLALEHLIKLCEASPWVTHFLSLHPLLLDELLDPRILFHPPDRKALQDGLKRRLEEMNSTSEVPDLEDQVETLCIFKQVNLFRICAADVSKALPLMKVSDRLTYIAETVLGQVLELCWSYLSQRHGVPSCDLAKQRTNCGFAVIAYGKLGGLELGYGSDLDLVFLHAASTGETNGSKRPIDNSFFFSRLGQRMIHILSAHTRAGRLYKADMRLRPSGSSGTLVSHVDVFGSYQENKAWTWEHQALVRARPICGDDLVIEQFLSIRRGILGRRRDANRLRTEVCDMRKRLREAQRNSGATKFDLKQGRGGIVDIEFLVQYLTLLKAHQTPELLEWTDNVRLLETLASAGCMQADEAALLKNAYLDYRGAAHQLSLQEHPAQVSSSRFRKHRKSVREIWRHYLGPA